MDELQKEFLSIKTMVNQRSSMLVSGANLKTIGIDEKMRDQIKDFWHHLPLEKQQIIFWKYCAGSVKLITKSYREFGKAYSEAGKNIENLNSIDKALMEKTTFATEDLPGFEGKIKIAQLYCNGRNSRGAYRIHHFYYLLPSEEFEKEENLEFKKIEDYLGYETKDRKFSSDAQFGVDLLRNKYKGISLKTFQHGIFLGNYESDNIWSVWRYMNGREFTLESTCILPLNLYQQFIDKSMAYFDRFLDKLKPGLLKELWKTNIRIAAFSTCFENNMLLSFFKHRSDLAILFKIQDILPKDDDFLDERLIWNAKQQKFEFQCSEKKSNDLNSAVTSDDIPSQIKTESIKNKQMLEKPKTIQPETSGYSKWPYFRKSTTSMYQTGNLINCLAAFSNRFGIQNPPEQPIQQIPVDFDVGGSNFFSVILNKRKNFDMDELLIGVGPENLGMSSAAKSYSKYRNLKLKLERKTLQIEKSISKEDSIIIDAFLTSRQRTNVSNPHRKVSSYSSERFIINQRGRKNEEYDMPSGLFSNEPSSFQNVYDACSSSNAVHYSKCSQKNISKKSFSNFEIEGNQDKIGHDPVIKDLINKNMIVIVEGGTSSLNNFLKSQQKVLRDEIPPRFRKKNI